MTDRIREHEERELDLTLDLAVLRTELAWDRTLLSWLRTTLALMGAGVVLDKASQLLHQARVLAGVAEVRNSHLLGLTLTGVSTSLLLIVCWQYVRSARVLARIKDSGRPHLPTALLASLLVVLLGCSVFIVLVIDRN